MWRDDEGIMANDVGSGFVLFKAVGQLLLNAAASFRMRDFPVKTKSMIDETLQLIDNNMHILRSTIDVEERLQDALIELRTAFSKYNNEWTALKNDIYQVKVRDDMQRKFLVFFIAFVEAMGENLPDAWQRVLDNITKKLARIH